MTKRQTAMYRRNYRKKLQIKFFSFLQEGHFVLTACLLFSPPVFAQQKPIVPNPSSKSIDQKQQPTNGQVSASPKPISAIYVETNGNDANSGRSGASALRTIQRAVDIAQPGDTILVGPGTYQNKNIWTGDYVADITKAGRADAWITIRSRENHKAVLSSNGWSVVKFGGGAAYWNIEDFEVVGSAEQITLDYALSQKDIANPLTNGNGIFADGRKSTRKPRHITVRNNIVHDTSGCGICTVQADYLTIEGNTVYDTSHYARYATSGIDLFQMWNTDSNSGYKNIIRNNFVYRNESYVPWEATGKISDGNGIIIDDFRHTQNGSTGTPYLGRTLVINNISTLNGGSGMHAYFSDKVDFMNNIAYHNSRSPDLDYPEIFASEASDVRIINNIIVPRSDGSVTSKPSSNGRTNVLFDYNIFFGKPLVEFSLNNNKQIDPLYSVNEASPLLSMFRPSPQFTGWIDAGLELGDVRLGGVYPPDFDGGVRPKGLTPDIGPFEK
ncbi:MAG TPA: DUF1565 domain-containing protein [Methylococcales bacterium]